MSKVKLEVTENQRRLHIGSFFTDLNESDYQELVKIFSKPDVKTVGEVKTAEEIMKEHGFFADEETTSVVKSMIESAQQFNRQTVTEEEINKLKKIISQKDEVHEAWSEQQSKIIKRIVIENKTLKSELEKADKLAKEHDGIMEMFNEKYRNLESSSKSEGSEAVELPLDIDTFYCWANDKFETDNRGSWKVVRDGCITYYSTSELYKDWKRGLI